MSFKNEKNKNNSFFDKDKKLINQYQMQLMKHLIKLNYHLLVSYVWTQD